MKLNSVILAFVFLMGALSGGVGIAAMVVAISGVQSFCPEIVVGR